MRSPLGLVCGVLAAFVLLAGCARDHDVAPAPAPEASAVHAAATPAELPASRVLREWDQARADAFASGDVDALRDLYLARSAAGTSDVRLLRAYLRRGLRVEGMRMQLLAVDVLHEAPDRLRVRVTDRLVGAVAVGNGRRTALPGDAASQRVVELRRNPAGRWRVAWVRPSSPRQAVR